MAQYGCITRGGRDTISQVTMEKTAQNKAYIGKVERSGYLLAALGQGAMYAMMTSWLSRFYTDVMRLDLLFVMALMWGARILFAFGDPIMGAVVDRTRSRFGKMRPYLRFAPFIVCALGVFLFVDFPGMDDVGKSVYAAVIYIVWGVMYAVCDVPFWGMPYAMTPDLNERNRFLSHARTFNSIGGALPVVLVALLISEDVLGIRTGMMVGAIIFSAIAIAPFSLTAYYTRERIEPQKEVMPVKKSLGLLGKCLPLGMLMLFGVLAFGRYMIQSSYTYAADYVFNYYEDANGFAAFIYGQRQIVGAALIGIGMFPSMLLMPKLLRKFSARTLAIFAGIGSGVILGLFYLVGRLTDYNFYAAIPFLFLGGMPLGIYNIITFNLAGECIDYIEYKFKVRAEGTVSSAVSFAGKIAAATSAGVLPLILELSDYVQPSTVDGVTVIAEQSPAAKNAIFMMMSLIPAISLVLSAAPMFFYPIGGRMKDEMDKTLSESHLAKIEDKDDQATVGEEAALLNEAGSAAFAGAVREPADEADSPPPEE